MSQQYDSVCIIGDVHGSCKELDLLLKKIPEDSEIIFLGDLVDRGPDSYRVVEIAHSLHESGRARLVKGNHESTMLRFMAYEHAGKMNPMNKPNPQRLEDWEKICSNPKFVEFLTRSPTQIEFLPNFHAVHAGLLNGQVPRDQHTSAHLYLRFVDLNDNNRVRHFGPDFECPENAAYWTEVYNQPRSVFYGHHVHSCEKPTVKYHSFTKDGDAYFTCGVDTGCVYGGRLSAAIVHKEAPFHPSFLYVDAVNPNPSSFR